jgi:hypothetical protein
MPSWLNWLSKGTTSHFTFYLKFIYIFKMSGGPEPNVLLLKSSWAIIRANVEVPTNVS